MRALIFAALLLTSCAGATIKPTIGECDQPAPALAMMGTPPESLHEMVKDFCGTVGLKIVPH